MMRLGSFPAEEVREGAKDWGTTTRGKTRERETGEW